MPILYLDGIYGHYPWVAIANNEQYSGESAVHNLALNVAMELLIITYAILRKATQGGKCNDKG